MDAVREWLPGAKYRLTSDELDLAIFLRGNESLYQSLCSVIAAPIEARTRLKLSKEPNDSMIILARDKELRVLLQKLEFIYKSPVITEVSDEGELPE